MKRPSTVGGRLAERFGLDDLRIHVSRALKSGNLAVTELLSDVPTPAPTARLAYDDAFLVGLQIRPSDHELWFDGRSVKSPPFRPGETCFYDLRRDPSALIKGPYHSLQFYVPRSVINNYAMENRASPIDDLDYELGAPIADPVIHHLAQAMLPAFRLSGGADSLFVDHVMQALAIHVAQHYGKVAPMRGPPGLARWQERRAKEVMDERLGGRVTLDELARACGLSVSHFVRGFRNSTGLPPYRWLTRQRIERAKDLLLAGGFPLSQVAIECGFADQSHFTRVFSRTVGTSPATWRRERAGSSSGWSQDSPDTGTSRSRRRPQE